MEKQLTKWDKLTTRQQRKLGIKHQNKLGQNSNMKLLEAMRQAKINYNK